MHIRVYRTLAMIGTLALSSTALAHTGPATEAGLVAGFLHPLTGIDHILVMFAVGLWAARRSSARLASGLPVLFLAFLFAGMSLGMAGIGLPALEAAIASSVLVMGVLMMTQTRLSDSTAVAVVSAAALLHGSAHGLAVPVTGAGYFISGVLLASLLLLAGGVAAGRALWPHPWLMRALGLATGLTGGLLLAV